MHAVLSMDGNVAADEDALWLGHDSHWCVRACDRSLALAS